MNIPSTPAPTGILINLVLYPGAQTSSLLELLPDGTRIVATVPDLSSSDSPDVEYLSRCYQVILPKGVSATDIVTLLIGAGGVEEVHPGPQVSLPEMG